MYRLITLRWLKSGVYGLAALALLIWAPRLQAQG